MGRFGYIRPQVPSETHSAYPVARALLAPRRPRLPHRPGIAASARRDDLRAGCCAATAFAHLPRPRGRPCVLTPCCRPTTGASRRVASSLIGVVTTPSVCRRSARRHGHAKRALGRTHLRTRSAIGVSVSLPLSSQRRSLRAPSPRQPSHDSRNRGAGGSGKCPAIAR